MANLQPSDEARTSAAVTVYAAYDHRFLHVLVSLQDDRFIPSRPAGDGTITGDDLLFGIAAESSPTHAEVRIDLSPDRPQLTALPGTTAAQLDRWPCALLPCEREDERAYHVRIPSAAVASRRLEPGTRLLLAVRYRDDDADGFPPTVLTWGVGLDGRRSAEDFRWAELAPPQDP